MSKKPDTASALAGILSARRGDETAAMTASSVVSPAVLKADPLPSPAPPQVAAIPAEIPPRKGRGGKSSDPSYSQFSVYLPKTLRKKVGRVLDDADTGQDFSELVEELLGKWLAANT